MTSAESLTNHTLYYVPARWRTRPPSLLTSAAAWFDEAQPVGADGWTGTAMPTSHQQSSLYSPCRRDLEREGGPLRGEDKKGPRCRLSRSISAAQLRSDGWERRRGGRYFIYRPPLKSVRWQTKIRNTVRGWFGYPGQGSWPPPPALLGYRQGRTYGMVHIGLDIP